MTEGRQLARWLPPEDWQPGPIELRFWVAWEKQDGRAVINLQNGWGRFRYAATLTPAAERQPPAELTLWWVRDADHDFTRKPLAGLHDLPVEGLCVAAGEVLAVSDDAERITLRLDGPERSYEVQLDQIEREDRPADPAPALRNVRYGPHARHLLDFYAAPGEGARPLAVYFHGGGWGAGDKREINGVQVRELNAAGIAVAAVSYRFLWMANEQGVEPPVEAPMTDGARAIQFLRHHAEALSVDPGRVAAWGGSAGGCTALWLAFHDDLADPSSDDAARRASTRLTAVAGFVPQTTLDPHQMRGWIGPEIQYGASAFAAGDFDRWHQRRDDYADAIARFSPIAHVSPDDPPVYLDYSRWPNTVPSPPNNAPMATHHPAFGVHLAARLAEAGVTHDLTYQGQPPQHWTSVTAFLIDQLTN